MQHSSLELKQEKDMPAVPNLSTSRLLFSRRQLDYWVEILTQAQVEVHKQVAARIDTDDREVAGNTALDEPPTPNC